MAGVLEFGKDAAGRWVLPVLRWLGGFFLPPVCVACEDILAPADPLGFCHVCYAKLPWWDTSRVLAPQLPRVVDSFKAPLLYRDPLRDVILSFKFQDKTPYALPLARLMVGTLPDDADAILVPVPLHVRRLRARFYNQSAMLAQELARLTGRRAVLDALAREGEELRQASKTRAGRLRLRAKDFTARAEAVAGKKVILVDDIYTTGATARACALALKRAGATAVHVRTVAYTPAGG